MICCCSTYHACRPTNRILLAQRTAVPQALVSVVTLAAHIPVTHMFTQYFGYVGAAYAYSLSAGINLVLIWTYVAVSGLGPRVWGKPSRDAFKVLHLMD